MSIATSSSVMRNIFHTLECFAKPSTGFDRILSMTEKPFTYRQLLQYLEALNSDELDQPVIVNDEGNNSFHSVEWFLYIDDENEFRVERYQHVLTFNNNK